MPGRVGAGGLALPRSVLRPGRDHRVRTLWAVEELPGQLSAEMEVQEWRCWGWPGGLVAPDSSPHTRLPQGEASHLSDSFGRDPGCGQAPGYRRKEYMEMVAGLG